MPAIQISQPIPMKLATLLLLSCALAVQAQYAINWFTMDAGGGQSAGGAYTLAGTTGQPDAGVQSGGAYTLVGGFWGAFSVAEPEPVPTLRIEHQGSKVTLAWQNPSTGYQLQESDSLSAPNWADVPDAPNLVGSEKQVSVLLEPGPRYYRLRKP